MRVALISDIHGNLVALEAVLADIDQAGVDQIVCLGDVAALGPQPTAVIAKLREVGCLCIRGNHEDELLTLDASLQPDPQNWLAVVNQWCFQQLSAADFDYFRSFQPTLEIALPDHTALLCCHGSPRANTENILITTTPKELDAMLAGQNAPVIVCGHTHVQMLRQHMGRLVVNVGSVGLPFEQMPFPANTWPRFLSWAEYTIITAEKGTIHVDLRRVALDMEAVKQAALTSHMPDAAHWAASWITL